MRLENGALASVEALVRWQHPRLGFLVPPAFLPAVERAGQLADLGTWVMRRHALSSPAVREHSPRAPSWG